MATELGWRLIMAGVLANFAFKIVLVAIMGNKILLKWVGITFGITILIGLGILFLWPVGWHF